jgi:hypothetical protein
MSHSELIKDFFELDDETFDDYEKKCLKHGYRYMRMFQNGLPILERLQ